ncbi:hypothetical protein N7509_004193 [Penicillium cosmopolitanum]|uniref:LDB19 N-terminal domain-containing protein n=1 Tax=Penicillium cosmopolitanum TaxID=1131564 RepID=A0A9X0BC77_9EURO|nr:uncharacterized protein N7509_004193 [Penicillium cosmopolitanum]KAJ5404322.1 hypothetical protein N7509_004193 [Penicillium cosmopolitanum]
MASSRLKLKIPSQYYIIHDPKGERCAQPISGTAILSTGFTQPETSNQNVLHICLICVLTTTEKKSRVEKRLLGRFTRWRLEKQSSLRKGDLVRSCSVIEELTLQPFANTCGQLRCNIPFLLPVPGNIPGTSITDIGEISYYLVATLNTGNGTDAEITHQEIKITRQILLEQPSLQHIRNYPGLNLITKIILTQDVDLATHSKIPVSAKVFVRPARPADRPIEYRCVAVRGIRWRIEEMTKVFSHSADEDKNYQPCQPIASRCSTSVISKGVQKGYWKIEQVSTKRASSLRHADLSVDIPLELSLSRDFDTTSAVDLRCYDVFSTPTSNLSANLKEIGVYTKKDDMMITIEHRLKLDILMLEDTFCVYKHELVDRRPLQTALDASFPLQISARARGNLEAVPNEVNPPSYNELPIRPPHYMQAT